jgi:hypothetical protein
VCPRCNPGSTAAYNLSLTHPRYPSVEASPLTGTAWPGRYFRACASAANPVDPRCVHCGGALRPSNRLDLVGVEQECEKYTRRTIDYASEAQTRIPAYLLVTQRRDKTGSGDVVELLRVLEQPSGALLRGYAGTTKSCFATTCANSAVPGMAPDRMARARSRR